MVIKIILMIEALEINLKFMITICLKKSSKRVLMSSKGEMQTNKSTNQI